MSAHSPQRRRNGTLRDSEGRAQCVKVGGDLVQYTSLAEQYAVER